MGTAGGGERRSSQVQKLVPGYETTVKQLSGSPKETPESTVMQFIPKLVEQVSGAEKYFPGIDFESLLIERSMSDNTELSEKDNTS